MESTKSNEVLIFNPGNGDMVLEMGNWGCNYLKGL